MKIAIGLLALALAASAASFAVGRPEAAAATGRASRVCLQVDQIVSHTALSNREIRFEMSNGAVWINTLKRECPGLRFENGFAWEINGGDVCANMQTIYVINRGTPCQLGDFTRVDPAVHTP